jgi:hypothetical protein
MHTSIDSFYFSLKKDGAKPKGGIIDGTILVEYNELLFDYWANAIFFETGNSRIIGRNDIKLGIPIVFGLDVPYNANKAFYVEEYTDEFTIGSDGETFWTQNLQLTRGIELEDLAALRGFSQRELEFTEPGSFQEK